MSPRLPTNLAYFHSRIGMNVWKAMNMGLVIGEMKTICLVISLIFAEYLELEQICGHMQD